MSNKEVQNTYETAERNYEMLKDKVHDQHFEIESLKSRIDKATEYTERFTNGKYSRIDTWENVEVVLQTILQLLKGEDK